MIEQRGIPDHPEEPFKYIVQVLAEDSLETTTASAIKTPHRHLSHRICPQDIAAPAAPVAASSVVLAFATGASPGAGRGVIRFEVVDDEEDEENGGKVGGGVAMGGRCSPILGRSFGASVQYFCEND